MTYNKPEVVLLTSAVDAVQSTDQRKLSPVAFEHSNIPTVLSAYEADE
jgi:hypothetical protein